ncbi:GntR family transcriptional regulator [Streptococcus massiliensis]|uniref:Putative transcriptional regulator n=1 Tax=Streptococcus massiliensis TaxID=313439 RepID=A0A380KYC7_9STRE|nr:GntR family transcriptional regulator [Streptococcus massiliensis]SUN75926.1 putative transcriptional regulator [Streptococcus massiliensis]
MVWNFDNNRPIYLQIMERLKVQIISNQLKSGERLLSVRELAEEAGVNPNTIQRALSELEKEGFVYAQRTAGRFVTDNHELILQTRDALAQEELNRFVTNMLHFGYEQQDLGTVVTNYINTHPVKIDKEI